MSNFDGIMLCDHSVFIHETVLSYWTNFKVFEFISIHNNTQIGQTIMYVKLIVIIFTLFKSVSRTILLYV